MKWFIRLLKLTVMYVAIGLSCMCYFNNKNERITKMLVNQDVALACSNVDGKAPLTGYTR